MNLKELGMSIASAIACGLDAKAVQEKIDEYFNDDRFRALDAEARNRQIKPTKEGLRFYLLQTGIPRKQVDEVLSTAFSGLINRLNYSFPKPGRPEGYSPINGKGGAMAKKNKAWSMTDDDWQWLESQPNQSEIIREAISLYRQQKLD